MSQTEDVCGEKESALRGVAAASEQASNDPCVLRALEEYVAAQEAGHKLPRHEFLGRYPEIASVLAECLDALEFVHSAAPHLEPPAIGPSSADPISAAAIHAAIPLGDYRIVREIGRGGMGVVYEAVQMSLGRRVALKVLPREAARDAKLRARFRRESQAAAQLHHSNIVPVFEVGQEGDISFYAMQYIQGQPLDKVIQELQQLRASSTGTPCPDAASAASAVARSLLTGQFEPLRSGDATLDFQPAPDQEPPSVGPAADTPVPAALAKPSELSMVESNYRLYCRNVARLGLQVAEALAYAHGRGVLHRDIKPSNLLLDSAGLVWVSDFGLAKTQEQALTETGDLVGTVRYMAPERFGGVCDARADVYALGLTLYELLLLRPPFDAPDRLRLIDQIGHQEPARPRSIDARIPRDLETILMKAIEKEPKRRYASAEALAGDLHRYLADEPIQARRVGPVERLGRWGRRNPLVASLSAAVVLVTALGFAGVFGQMQVARANEQEANANATQAKEQRDDAQRQRDEVKALNDQLRRTLYVSNMNLAQHAWDAGGVERVRELLERHRPKAGEPDLRGFEWYYLDRLSHSELLTVEGNVAFSPDGKRLASSARGRVKVWDAQTGQELLARTVKGDTPTPVAFSPDGKRLASVGSGELKVWDAQTGQELLALTLKGDTRNVTLVAFSPDGKRLVSGFIIRDESKKAPEGSELGVKVWDAQTGQELLSLKKSGHGNVIFSPDGKRLAAGRQGTWDDTKRTYVSGEVTIWDAQTGQELLSLKVEGYTSSLAFSPDGKRLARASGDVKVWDAQTGQELLTIKGGGWVGLAFSPDGKRLAIGAIDEKLNDRLVKVWDAQTGQELLSLQGHISQVNTVAFSPDGKRLASAGGGPNGPDPTVRVWDAQTGRQLFALKGHTSHSVWEVAFSPDGTRLASTTGRGRESKVWDVTTSPEARTFQVHTGEVTGLAFSPDGKRLATGNGRRDQQGKALPGDVKVWDARTGQELLALKVEGFSLAFSPDGKRLASGAKDRTVRVWDAQTGQELLTCKGHTRDVKSVTFSPDGKRLASVGGNLPPSSGGPPPAAVDAEVKVWDAQTGQELLSLKKSGHGMVIFSPDGKRLASSAWDEKLEAPAVKVWDAQTGQELLSITGGGGLDLLAFSPDGKRLASAGRWHLGLVPGAAPNPTVRVWDAQTGQEVLTLKGHSQRVSDVAFSPDGKRLASVSLDKTVKVWDAQTGQELLTFTVKGSLGIPNWDGKVAFSPDGHRLASTSPGGTVTIWDATPLPEKP